MKPKECFLKKQQQALQKYLDENKSNKNTEKEINLYKVPKINIQEDIYSSLLSKELKNSILTIESESHNTVYNFSPCINNLSLSTVNKPIPSLLFKNIDSLFKTLFVSNSKNQFIFHSKQINLNPKCSNQSYNNTFRNSNNIRFNYPKNTLQLEGRRLTSNELRDCFFNSQSTSRIYEGNEKELCSRQKRLLSKNKRYITLDNLACTQSKNTANQTNNIENISFPIIQKDIQFNDIPKINSETKSNTNINTNTNINNNDFFKKDSEKKLNARNKNNNYNTLYSNNNKEDISYYTPDFNYYIIQPENCGYIIKQCMNHRINWKESQSLTTSYFHFQWCACSNKINYHTLSRNPLFKQCVNHYEYHSSISNKSKMFLNLLNHCEENKKEVFQYIPFTIILNQQDQSFYNTIESFKKIFTNISDYIYDYDDISHKTFSRRNTSYISMIGSKEHKMGNKTNIMIPKSHYKGRNIWIFKTPNLNRGRCIKLINSIDLLNKYIKQSISGDLKDYSDENNNKIEGIDNQEKFHSKTIILQKYIEKPLLYYNRKFDIRIWALLTHKYEVYALKEGHLKTCSVDYDCNDINSYVHITNYSLQKYNKQFSKYEKGNEVSFDLFQKYLDEAYSHKMLSVKGDLFPKFKEIIELTFKSAKNKLNSDNRHSCFEIFGYDFMMDEMFNIYLIEINTNPGLEDSSEIIKAIVPRMIDDSLRLTIDLLFDSKYSEECFDINSKEYCSPYKVQGYNDKENLWEFVCDLSKNKQKITNKKVIHNKYKVNKKKKRKNINE